LTTNLAVANSYPVEENYKGLIETTNVIEVVDQETYRAAGERCKTIVAYEKEIFEYFEPMRKAADDQKKIILAKRDALLDPLAEKKAAQVAKLKSWDMAQERVRLESERKAQEAARKAAEDEALARAAALEKEATPEAKAEAEAIIQAPVLAPQIILPSSVPKGYGTFTRKTWKASVTDLRALVRGVAEGFVPLQAIAVNEAWLNGQARALRAELKYPGVVPFES
jgi:hypothetical protein